MRDVRTGTVRPILKWAGGKRQLLPELRPFYPQQFDRYIEPFLGSGAVFLDLHNMGLLEGRKVVLSDINADVIGCYRSGAGLSRAGRARRCACSNATSEPAERRISTRSAIARSTRRGGRCSQAPNPAAAYTPALAAMLIYLNRTGFNGLFRVNGRGEFNVPAGRYVESADLRRGRTCTRGATRSACRDGPCGCRPFDRALAHAGGGRLRLPRSAVCPVERARRGSRPTRPVDSALRSRKRCSAPSSRWRRDGRPSCSAIPPRRRSGSSTPGIRSARSAGLRATTVAARRAINSRAASRGPVREYLITNVARRSV